MRQSKKSLSITPPLTVTLNRPSRGLTSASSTGHRMYQASTVS